VFDICGFVWTSFLDQTLQKAVVPHLRPSAARTGLGEQCGRNTEALVSSRSRTVAPVRWAGGGWTATFHRRGRGACVNFVDVGRQMALRLAVVTCAPRFHHMQPKPGRPSSLPGAPQRLPCAASPCQARVRPPNLREVVVVLEVWVVVLWSSSTCPLPPPCPSFCSASSTQMASGRAPSYI
jgi:hypothetical protein